MKLCNYISFIFLLIVFSSAAQKQTEKIIDAKAIERITINGEGIFTVAITSAKSQAIKLKTKFEGEYQNDLITVTKIENNTLFIAVNFQPFFKMPNNKLSAHKVLANDLILEIPEYLSVAVKSAISRVVAKGNFKNFKANLHSGSCSLLNFEGNATIKTIEGNIIVKTTNADVDAFSKYGKVILDKIPNGNNRLKLTTVNGNISTSKAEK